MFRFDSETPPTLKPLQLKAPDIEQWLLDRDPVDSGGYGSFGPEEYARAFTAAQTAGTDIANDLYLAMLDTVRNSGSEQDFAAMVTPILRAKGWLKGDDDAIATRVALVYDTNLRLARSAGRWANYQRSARALPYLHAFTAEDSRVRHPPKSPNSDHRAWDGITLPIDHPFWQTYWPPLGFRCRCAVVQWTRSQLARYAPGVTSEADLADRIERIGSPVFASPGAPIETQLATMVAPSNDRTPRMPGLPKVDPVETKQAGGDIWDAVLKAQSLDDVGKRLAEMFG